MNMGTDIAIIGAGFSGLALTHSLVNNGLNLKITLIERQNKYPHNLRSDKIEVDQARMMRELGILEYKLPSAGTIGNTVAYNGEKEWIVNTIEQYGIDYTATVNNLRKRLPDSIEVINDSVNDITDTQDEKLISLSNNGEIHAKLAVICTGGTNKLINRLGIEKYRSDKLRSLTFGFDIKRKDNSNID